MIDRKIILAGLSLWLLLGPVQAQDEWANETQHTDNSVEIKIITLSLEETSVKIFNGKNGESLSAVMFVNSRRDLNYAESLATGLELDGRVYIIPLYKEHPPEKNDYQISRVKRYIKDGKMQPRFPSFNPQYQIVSELFTPKEGEKTGDNETAVLSGASCILPFTQKIYGKKFSRYVMLSPSGDFDLYVESEKSAADANAAKSARFLWVGSAGEKSKLEGFQKKYGGEILLFENSGGGYTIFQRSHDALEKLKNWLTGA